MRACGHVCFISACTVVCNCSSVVYVLWALAPSITNLTTSSKLCFAAFCTHSAFSSTSFLKRSRRSLQVWRCGARVSRIVVLFIVGWWVRSRMCVVSVSVFLCVHVSVWAGIIIITACIDTANAAIFTTGNRLCRRNVPRRRRHRSSCLNGHTCAQKKWHVHSRAGHFVHCTWL